MQGRKLEKLMERFVRPYQMKKISLTNAIKLDLLSTVKIHPVVNINRVHRYKDQVEGQRKEQPSLVIINRKKEYEVEKILNKRKFRGKDRYLVQQKGYTVKEDTWKLRENLGNTQDLVDKFEEEYREGIRQIKKRNSRKDYKEELLGRCIAKMLYRQNNKRLDREYWGRMERN